MDKRPLLESDSLEKTQEMSTALTRDDTNITSGASYVSLTPAEDKKGQNQRKTWTGKWKGYYACSVMFMIKKDEEIQWGLLSLSLSLSKY